MTTTEITTFINDYQNRFGESLGTLLETLPKAMTTTAFVNRVELLIDLLLDKNPRYEFIKSKLSTTQTTKIHEAQLEQAYYMIHTEDYSVISGIDFANGTLVDKKQIDARLYSKLAVDILKGVGLLYTGLRQPTNPLLDLF